MVKNYTEWKQAVVKEHTKLVEVSFYLNEAGKKRMRVFDILSGLAFLCETPQELLTWIESKEGMDKHDIAYLETGHAQAAIHALRMIANQ